MISVKLQASSSTCVDEGVEEEGAGVRWHRTQKVQGNMTASPQMRKIYNRLLGMAIAAFSSSIIK